MAQLSLHEQILQKIEGQELCYGLIHKIHGHFYYLKPLAEWEAASIEVTLPTRLQKEGMTVFVGDLVEIDEEKGTIRKVLPRLSLLNKPRVANVDRAAVVVALQEPTPDWNHLNRLLCSASLYLPQQPLICLSKIDLWPAAAAELPAELAIYEQLGYRLLPLSTKTGQGLAQLQAELAGSCAVLAGKSGVGKSSLLNCLCPNLNLKVGELSSRSAAGTHTTRHIEIHRLPSNNHARHTLLLDTPGFSRLDVEFSAEELWSSNAFPELTQTATSCRFPDCTHTSEEGCAVDWSEFRQQTYQQILEECRNWEATQLSSRKAKQAQQTHKQVSKTTIPLLKRDLRSTSRRRDRQSLPLEDEDS